MFLCISFNSNAQKTAQLAFDIGVKLNLSQIPQLNQSNNLYLEVFATRGDIHDVSIKLVTENSIVINKQEKNKRINLLQKGINYHDAINFSVNKTGQHKIMVVVTGETNGSRFTDRYVYVYFTVAEKKELSQIGWENSIDELETNYYPLLKKTILKNSNGLYDIYTADQQLNMVVEKNHSHYFHPLIKGTIGNVIISGNYSMRNRSNNSNIPYKNHLIQLINGTSGAHLAWSYTDPNGNFVFPTISNPGIDGVSVRVYSILYQAGGKGYGVCNPSVCVDNSAAMNSSYSQFYTRTSLKVNVLDGNQNIGSFVSPFSLSGNLRAMWIKHDMDKAYSFNVRNNISFSSITAQWSATSTDGNYYNIGGNIHFKADVANGTNHTVLHEVGHNVMYNAGTFPTTISDCPNPHYVNLVSGTQCAWTEGWASAYASMVNNNPTRCFAPSTSNCISYETDSSFDNCIPDWDCGIDSYKVEGHITGALWDLYDLDNDGFDVQWFDSNEIISTTISTSFTSFQQWWDGWLNLGFSAYAIDSLFQNNLNFSPAYDIKLFNVVHFGTQHPLENDNFFISVDIINQGGVSSVDTTITFYLSPDPIISPFDQEIASINYGLVEVGETIIPYVQTSMPTAGSYYFGACFSDIYGFDENDLNNCSQAVLVTIAADFIFDSGFE